MQATSSLPGSNDKPAYNSTFLYYDILQTLVNAVPYICDNLNETTSQIVTCPYKDRSIPALTYQACISTVNSAAEWYSGQDVYDRVLLWRVPLLALWATTTLPEIAIHFWPSLHTKCFTLVHLVGDPIDAIYSMLYKLDLAQRSVEWSRDQDVSRSSYSFRVPDATDNGIDGNDNSDALVRRQSNVVDRNMKERKRINLLENEDENIRQYYQDVIALLLTAFDGHGVGEEAVMAMRYHFHSEWPDTLRESLRKRCAIAAFYIASDRVSKFLPSVASIASFLVQISAGFWKILSAIPGDAYDPSNAVSEGLNRAPHNIAFGVLFFWLPIAVMMTAWIGGSQTPHLVPRELEHFALDVRELFRGQIPKRPIVDDHEMKTYFPAIVHGGNWARGGLPVWQTGKFSDQFASTRRRWSFRIFAGGLSIAVIALPTACAMSISWLTPSDGFGCRSMTQLTFFMVWLFSATCDWILFKSKDLLFRGKDMEPEDRISMQLERIYWITFAKDFAVMSGTIITLTYTALGIFNKCDCWSMWLPLHSVRYISFAQEPYIFHLIKYRLRYVFSYITVGAVFAQIIILGVVILWFWDGYTVLKQRDIDAVLEGSSWSTRLRAMMISTRAQPTSEPSSDAVEAVERESFIPKSERTPRSPGG